MAQLEGKPRFVTVAEVAALMRVSRMTVYRMVHAGELPAVRMGRSYRVPLAAVEELIAEGLGSWDQDRDVEQSG
ncbi:MAG: helix-turn-helix domain-containing protein [Bowdeniella nasicola]|nr:helix-turn-helix domain-containing protein [Bowdeniella nasicola]